MGKHLIKLGISVCMSLVVLFVALYLNGNNSHQESDENFRPHIMVRNQIYWLSAHPCDESVSQASLTYIGLVEEKVATHPKHDFQAYGITEGTQVYLDDRFPNIIYLKAGNVFDCYATGEMSMDYVYFTGNIYVSLSSLCSWEYEQYKDHYVPIYGDEISKPDLPISAQLVGETVFVGHHMPVTGELETNAFCDPVSVYRDNTALNILSVGNNNMIYVPLEKQFAARMSEVLDEDAVEGMKKE